MIKVLFPPLFPLLLLIASKAACMQPVNRMQENGGSFGKLPQHLLIHIASFCRPTNRCILRCTGNYLNQQLQGPNYPEYLRNKEQKLINTKRQLKLTAYITNYLKTVARRTDIIYKTCYAIDCLITVCGTLSLLKTSTADGNVYNQKILGLPYFVALPLLGIQLTLGLFEYSRLLKKSDNQVYPIWQSDFPAGLCSLLITRPIVYCYGLCAPLYNRNTFIQQATHCLSSYEDYLHSIVYTGYRDYISGTSNILRICQAEDRVLKGKFLRFIAPSQRSLLLITVIKARKQLHALCKTYLPSCNNRREHHTKISKREAFSAPLFTLISSLFLNNHATGQSLELGMLAVPHALA